MATNQLFEIKKMRVRTANGARITARGVSWCQNGPVPAIAKKAVAAIQIDSAEAETLKTARYVDRTSRFIHKATISVSRTTVSVPAATPNSRTEANTKVSETVNLRDIDGTLIVNDPVSRVRAPRTSHSGATGWL